jgi:hypothetical protein
MGAIALAGIVPPIDGCNQAAPKQETPIERNQDIFPCTDFVRIIGSADQE